MMNIKKMIVNLMRRIVDTGDLELIRREKASLKFKALSVDKIFTNTTKDLNEFLEIADSLNTFQRKEIKQIKDVIKLIKKYHISQLTEVELSKQVLEDYIKVKKKTKKLYKD